MKVFKLATPILLLCVIASTTALAQTQSSGQKELENAIAKLRHIDLSKMSFEQKEKMAEDVDKAWKFIAKSGKPGVVRLKTELDQLDARNEKDDFFKLNASALLWRIGKFDEVETITRIWNSTPLTAQYNYVFYTAFEAAQTQDPRVLPMLKAVLRDKEGTTHLSLHAMDVRWPLSHAFIWGAYGSKGLPVLNDILTNSGFSVELESAMHLLTVAQYLPALPRIRALAKSPLGEVRQTAIKSLGIFGHPQDYEFLIAGLRVVNLEERFQYVFALYEFEDTRAVPLLIPLLKTDNEFLRREVIATLAHLLTTSSIDALNGFCVDVAGKAPMGSAERGECEVAKNLLEDVEVKLEEYLKLSPSARQSFVAEQRKAIAEAFRLKKEDKVLSRENLVAALNEWKLNGRAFSDKIQFEQVPGETKKIVARMNVYGWVDERHILTVGTVDDIPALLDVKASILGRLSDECLYETKRFDNIIQRLGRQRYRTEVGLTDKAEEKN